MVSFHSDLDALWVVLCTFLVFMMQFGFALIEAGCVRSKNTINVAMKNMVDATFGFLFFWLIGFGLMFGADRYGLIGFSHFFIDGNDDAINIYFLFQAMFATTATTIISGAVAERMKFNAYVLVTILVVSFIYPVFGHWAWASGGWLKELGFIDFAGSTVVHSVGAWVGLAGAIILGPRLGRFRDTKVIYFAPSHHNFIVFGVFVLWFSWFGFNAGSQLAFESPVSKILLNTLMSGAAGGFGAYLISIVVNGKVNVELFSFGVIVGLVGITAGCAYLTLPQAAIVGFISAFVMFIAEKTLLRLKIDDPLSAVAVHGFGGMWGTLAVGLFATPPSGMSQLYFFGIQAIGVSSAFLFSFGCGIPLFVLLHKAGRLRVSKRHEVLGLNVTEHQAKLPWVETIDSIIRIMNSGNFNSKVHEERGTEVGIVARFFNHLLGKLRTKQGELMAYNKNLRTQVNTDPLTQVFNRRGLMENIRLREAIDKEFSIIIIDIDHFKQINDSYGHDVGDAVLKELVHLVQKQVRDEDIFARWGGEEFVLLSDTANLKSTKIIAEKLRERISEHVFVSVGSLTCSFGVSSPTDTSTTFDALFKYADTALYQAKENGRNRVVSAP